MSVFMRRSTDPLPPITGQDDFSYYSLRDASRIARIPITRLRRWMAAGVVTPSRQVRSPSDVIVERGFSLTDVGYLHLLRHLRTKGISLEESVEHLHSLLNRFGPPGPKWRDSRLTILADHPRRTSRLTKHTLIASVADVWEDTVAVPGRQGASQRVWLSLLEILPDEVSLETILVPHEFLAHVEISPNKADGLPVARGTNVRTAVIRSLLDQMSIDEFHRDIYPHVSKLSAMRCAEFERDLDKAAA